MRARRTQKVTRTDSPTASKARKSRAAKGKFPGLCDAAVPSYIVEVNINDRVRVKMNALGVAIAMKDLRTIVEDEHGWSEWQLWDLMGTFGPHLFMGCSVPFETGIELILRKR